MSNKLQERLKEVAKECGGNRALCEKSGVSERTFANWLAGSSEPKVIGISAIANAASVTIDWIVTGANPKQRLGARFVGHAATVQVPLIDQELLDIDAPVFQRLNVKDHVPFSIEFLKNRLGRDEFDDLCVLEARGDSMDPTMGDGDFVLIDRSATKVFDGLSAFIFKETIYIKRVINVLEGVEVISDNKALYPPHRIEGKDLESLKLIGHVIWVGKTVY